jgi:hypothetical protein
VTFIWHAAAPKASRIRRMFNDWRVIRQLDFQNPSGYNARLNTLNDLNATFRQGHVPEISNPPVLGAGDARQRVPAFHFRPKLTHYATYMNYENRHISSAGFAPQN